MSTAYEIKGDIVAIMETQTFASGFQKRTFVVKTEDEKFSREIPLEVVKDKCAVLDGYRIGDGVTVQFNLRGNEHNGRWYVSLAAWKIEKEARSPEHQSYSRSATQGGAPPPTETATADDFQEDDSIPF